MAKRAGRQAAGRFPIPLFSMKKYTGVSFNGRTLVSKTRYYGSNPYAPANMKSESFNVAVCPPPEISQKAVNVSEKLKKKGGLFVLDGKNYFPHITIYMAQFPMHNVPNMRRILGECALKTKPFRVSASRYRQSSDGWIDVVYRQSKNIKAFQKNIIACLNPLREGLLLPRDEARMSKFGRTEQRNIKRYGYRSIGAEFFPHLTFTKLEKFDVSAFPSIGKSVFSFEVDRISLFCLGDYGTCRKVVELLACRS